MGNTRLINLIKKLKDEEINLKKIGLVLENP